MKILILYNKPILVNAGGVQRVSQVLANQFLKDGHSIYYLASTKAINTTYSNCQFFLPDLNNISNPINYDYLRNLINDLGINLILNQEGLSNRFGTFLSYVRDIEGLKICSVLHNSPYAPVVSTLTKFDDFINSVFLSRKFIYYFLTKIYNIKHRTNYRNLIKNSNSIVVLAESYKTDLLKILNCHTNKVYVIGNPTTLKAPPSISVKENSILFVGRLDIKQKRLDLLLKSWALLDYDLKEKFRLDILGDGPDKKFLKNLTNKMNLKNVVFHGNKDPEKFYEKALILCMTSAFEGYPLVINEARINGVYPIVFDSFGALRDIILSPSEGGIIKNGDIQSFANSLSLICRNRSIISSSSLIKSTKKMNSRKVVDMYYKTINYEA
jgi:glycosyltransferase involved in cell wall biosynthesis